MAMKFSWPIFSFSSQLFKLIESIIHIYILVTFAIPEFTWCFFQIQSIHNDCIEGWILYFTRDKLLRGGLLVCSVLLKPSQSTLIPLTKHLIKNGILKLLLYRNSSISDIIPFRDIRDILMENMGIIKKLIKENWCRQTFIEHGIKCTELLKAK